jgi:hypothetical protein
MAGQPAPSCGTNTKIARRAGAGSSPWLAEPYGATDADPDMGIDLSG